MSTHHYHAVIWIDHHEARIFHFNPTDVERLVLHPDHPTRHIHHKANSIGSGHLAADSDYLHAAAEAIAAELVRKPERAACIDEPVRLLEPIDPVSRRMRPR